MHILEGVSCCWAQAHHALMLTSEHLTIWAAPLSKYCVNSEFDSFWTLESSRATELSDVAHQHHGCPYGEWENAFFNKVHAVEKHLAKYNVLIMFESCLSHVQVVFKQCSNHVQHAKSCSAHVQVVFKSCSNHVPISKACSVHVQIVF